MFIRVRWRFLTDTREVTPRVSANPPPLAPIMVGSVSGLPSLSLLQISKKLEMPAGQKTVDDANGTAGCAIVLSVEVQLPGGLERLPDKQPQPAASISP